MAARFANAIGLSAKDATDSRNLARVLDFEAMQSGLV
jgi:hypothetical protein